MPRLRNGTTRKGSVGGGAIGRWWKAYGIKWRRACGARDGAKTVGQSKSEAVIMVNCNL